jgi:hypothetical protein
MSSSSLEKAEAVTSGQPEQNLNPGSPKLRSETRLDVDSSELMHKYESPQPQTTEPAIEEPFAIAPVGEKLPVAAAETDTVLVRLDEAQRALAEAESIQEVKQIVDVAEAARIYLKRSKQSARTIYAATSLRIRAERRLGEMLIEARKVGMLRTSDDGRSKGVDDHDTLTLTDLDITRDESARAQKLAAVPLAEFEKRMLTCQDGGALSISFILREIDVHRARKPQKSGSNAKAKSRSPKRSKSPAAATTNEPQVEPEAIAETGEPVSAGADTKPVAADTPEPPLLQITTALAPPGAFRKVLLAENLVQASWELEAVIQNRIRPVLEQLKSETALLLRAKLMKRLGKVEMVLTMTLERLRECAKLAPLTSRMADDEDEAQEDKDQ